MRWFEFVNVAVKPVKRTINVRQLGFQKLVIVRTKLNGGVKETV